MMTDSVAPPSKPSVRPITDVDWEKVLRSGALAGLMLSFICAIGMVTVLDERTMIDPWLSLGYLALVWVPVFFGFTAASEPTPDGGIPPVKGERDLLSGLVTGALAGLFFSFFIVLIDTYDMTDIFSNLLPRLVDLLTFDRGIGVAAAIWIVGCALLGLGGGAAQLASPKVKRMLTWAVVGVAVVAMLEAVIVDLSQGLHVEFVTDFMFAKNGGLTTGAAVILGAIFGAAGFQSSDKSLDQRRQERMSQPKEELRRKNMIAAGIATVAVIFVPMVVGGLTNELFANVGLFVLLGLGLNIVVGSAGLLDLGYVAFFAVGAYTTAILTSPLSPYWVPELTLDFLSWEGWLIVAVVLVMAAISGILVGTPVIRLRGDYLAIVTLGFGEIVRILFLSDWLSPYFGGAQGITNIPSAAIGPVEIKGTSSQSIFYLIAVFGLIAVYVAWRLQSSRTGRAWSALREDEDVAEAMGINTTAVKLTAFVTGAVLAGFAGMIFAVKVGSVFPISFRLLVSIIILVIVIVGGMGSIAGVVVGAVVLIGVLGGPTQPGLLQEFGQFKLLIYGALLVIMMLKRPEGLWPSVRRQRELRHEELNQDAWLTGTPGTDEEEDEA
jgi:branched-chain amino acid transport system permease protein